jgi:hypothetical protein
VNPTSTSSVNGTVTFLGAWLLVIVFAVALAGTGWGKTILYYILWLAVIMLVLSHASEISNMLNAGGVANQT